MIYLKKYNVSFFSNQSQAKIRSQKNTDVLMEKIKVCQINFGLELRDDLGIQCMCVCALCFIDWMDTHQNVIIVNTEYQECE